MWADYFSILKKQLFIFCLLFIFFERTAAQTAAYHVQVINRSGLVNPSEIIQLIKDNNGFLWLLSPTKAQRYDGKNFSSFSFNDRCINIQQDVEGVIWVASRQSIYRYKNDYTGFEKLAGYSADTAQYLSMHAGPGKKIFLLTKKNFLQWNTKKQQFDKYPIKLSPIINSFPFLQSKGNYLFYQKSEMVLARYNVLSGKEDEVMVNSSNYIFPVNEDTVWVRQNIGGSVLVSFTAKKIMPITTAQFTQQFNDSRFFVTGSNSNFSFVCFNDKGYHAYNSAINKFSPIKLLHNGLPLGGSTPINSFYEEANGNIWFANEEGLVHFNPEKNTIGLLRSNAVAGENWSNYVRNITEDEEDNIWFATGNGFCRLNKITGAVKTWLPKFESDNYINYSSIRSIGYCNSKIIVGQSEKGFWIFNPLTNLFTRPKYENDTAKKIFESAFNSNMIKLRNGNFLILSRKLWLMEKDNFKVRQIKLENFETIPRSAYEDAQERIWLLGNGGIFAVNKNFNLLYSLADKLKGKWYNSIVQINENTFWVAAKNVFEIKLLPAGKLKLSPLFIALKNVHFSHLYKDSLSHIWMFSDDGIYRYLPKQKILEKFDRNDNAQPYNVSISNSFRSRNGTLYAGSTNGINYFIPEKIPLQNDFLRVQLTNIIVNGNDSTFLVNKSLPKLTYLQNSLVFNFTAPYIYNGEKVQYRCRLQGADNDWTYLGNENAIRYTSLTPGNYIFNISASLNGKDWYENEKPFSFSVAPPFWQSWWFRLLLLFATSLAIYKFIGLRGKQIAKREAHKTEVEKLKSVNLQNQLEIEQVVNYFATSMGSQTNVDDMLWDVAKNCISKLGFEDCVIYLKDNKRNVLLQKAAWGPKTNEHNKIISPIEIDFGKGIVGAVAASGKAEIIADTTIDKRYIIDDANRLSEITVPILGENNLIGILDSEHSQKNFYTKQHLQILSTIAAMLSDNIEKMQAQQQARYKEIELLQLNKDLSDWQVAALRAQMNPHFIFNAMNSIQQFTLKNDTDNANLYLSKFSILLRKVLHSSQQNFILLEEEMEQLKLYLDIETLRMGDVFTYKVKADEEIETDAIKIPGMLIQPFVENALKHGLAMKEGEKKLEIKFCFTVENNLIATITDNGIGRHKAKQLKEQQEKLLPHQSNGIQLVEERLRLLNKESSTENLITITDITDSLCNPLGTSVTIVVPILQA